MTRLLAAVAALAAILLAAPRSAPAFEYMATCEGRPAAWAQGEVLTYRLSSTHVSDDLEDGQVRAALAAAWQEWSTPACSTIEAQLGEPVEADPFDEAVEESVIGFYEDAWPASLGAGLLALTRIRWAGDCTIFDGDIVFNGAENDWILGPPGDEGGKDLQSVATHEIGHFLGIDHTEIAGSTMGYPYEDDTSWRTLGCDDSAAVCDLYASDDVSCSDSAYCPCAFPCIDGVCEGLIPEVGPESCWETFNPEQSLAEEEPNDSFDAPMPIEGDGGDLLVSGSLYSCGNEDGLPTGDQDWLAVAAPCSGRAWISLESSTFDSVLDLVVFEEVSPLRAEQSPGPGDPIGFEVELGQDFELQLACWEGSPANWTLRVHYLSPGEQGGFIDEEDSGCGCSGSGSRSVVGLLAGLLAGLLGLGRLRGHSTLSVRSGSGRAA